MGERRGCEGREVSAPGEVRYEVATGLGRTNCSKTSCFSRARERARGEERMNLVDEAERALSGVWDKSASAKGRPCNLRTFITRGETLHSLCPLA